MSYVYRRPFDMRTRKGLSILMYVAAVPELNVTEIIVHFKQTDPNPNRLM